MTVKELIERLENLDQDKEIRFDNYVTDIPVFITGVDHVGEFTNVKCEDDVYLIW